jgi:hypothetical protein
VNPIIRSLIHLGTSEQKKKMRSSDETGCKKMKQICGQELSKAASAGTGTKMMIGAYEYRKSSSVHCE